MSMSMSKISPSANGNASQQPGHLCELCASCFYDNYLGKAPHHANYTDLEYAANAGCFICIRLCRDVKKAAGTWDAPMKSFSTHYFVVYDNWSPDSQIDCVTFEITMGEYWSSMSFRCFDHSRYPQIMWKDIPATMKDPRCMQLAKTWLRECRAHHDCQAESRFSTRRTNPRRLLCVEYTDASLLKVRLHYPSITEDLDYLTLSHVWGTQKFLTLKKENHDAFLQGITIAELSKTFQDALHVTVELEFRYLWIDSLCIVQDDPEDWEVESKRMAQVYKNAVCNILAAATSASMSGFLLEQRALSPIPPGIRSVEIPGRSNKERCVTEFYPWGNLRQAELYQRAWVLQEQVLATRALHFYDDQIHWECSNLYANELCPLGLSVNKGSSLGAENYPSQAAFMNSMTLLPWHFDAHSIHDNQSILSSRASTWARIISDYSFRKLTYPSDQFPALSGLVVEFGELDKSDRCISGMWVSQLPSLLLWEQPQIIDLPAIVSTPASPDWSKIPSWSWASIGAGVKWESKLIHISEEDYMCSMKTESVTGANCALRIRGFPLRLYEEDSDRMIASWCGSSQKPSIDLPRLGLRCDYHFDAWYSRRMLSLVSGDKDAFLRLVMAATTILPVLCLPDGEVLMSPWRCLVLRRDIESARGVYHRVGIARIWVYYTRRVPPASSYNYFTALLKSRAKDFTDSDFIRRDEDGTIQIELI